MNLTEEELDHVDGYPYIFKCELPKRKQRNNLLAWWFWLILIFVCLLLGASCKKKTTQPKQDTITTPMVVKGKMDGTYQWYAGDSATVDLVLTTYILDCSYCTLNHYDYYYSNLEVGKSYNGQYYACPAGELKDTLIFGYNSKVFKYVRK